MRRDASADDIFRVGLLRWIDPILKTGKRSSKFASAIGGVSVG